MKKTSNRLAPIVLSITVLFGTPLLIGGCSSDGQQSPSDGGSGDARADGSTTPVDGAIPDTAAGRALAWVVDVINGHTVTEADVNQRFNASFLAQVPAAQLIEILTEFGTMKPLKVESLEGASTASALTAVLTSADNRYWRLQLATDGSGKVAALLVTAAGDLDPTLKSWAAITERAAAVAPQVNLLAATLDDRGCVPIHAVAADASLAIGSTFKLWVLAALAEQIRAGTHSWSETMPIDDAHKSLPTGVLQDQPAGTRLALSIFASQMISISDNTAADHLLFLLGREAVESMLPLTGHHAPAENQPFLSTRELFTLKLMATSAEQAAYTSGSTEQKRALLTQYDTVYDPRTYSGPDWTTPRLIDRLEWFASPTDLCQVMRSLHTAGRQPATAPVQEILALNPGLPDSTKTFSYVGFKGGSEPGVLNLTWLLQRKVDQQWLVLTMGFNDPVKEIDAAQAVYVAAAARALAGSP